MQHPQPRDRRGRILAALAAVLIALAGLAVALAGGGDESAGPDAPATITSQTKQGPIKAPAVEVEKAKSDGETGLGDESISPSDQAHNDQEADPDAPRIVGPPPAATAHQAGCTTRQNTHNYSYRNGVRPSLIPLHLTVSANATGWGDVNGNAIFLNRAATQASSNYIIDAEGHCLLTVPETLKAWTQGNFNGASACSFEVINTGSEATYAGTAGLNKLARVVHDCAHRWGIPLRRGSVSGSRVTRSGVLAHLHLGIAGGGHVDIRRFASGCRRSSSTTPDVWPCVDIVIAKARALDKPPISKTARSYCRQLNALREDADKAGGWEKLGPGRWALARRRAASLTSHGYICTAGKGSKPGSVRRK